MIDIYINGNKRADLRVVTGGSLEQTEAHVTSSTISVALDIGTPDLREYDYIRFSENNRTIFAGTILSISQRDLENPTLSYRIYDLSLASNADYLANVFVDMSFPSGANVTQILLGNHAGDPWYQATLGEFYGIVEVRVVNEGISVGNLDDFQNVVLSDPAYLWGQPVSGVLDQLADVSGAWWEVTPDKVFNMRLTSSREVAPIALTENTSAYNVQVTRDAYTMYSAVRVVGGDGKGQYEEYQIKKNGVTGLRFERISDTVIRSRYPLFSINTVYNVGSGLPSNVPAVVKVGFEGIDDDDPSCQALMNYGGYEITLKEGYTWLDITPDTNYIQVNGNLLIQIYSRLVDSDIAAQIRSQRGGTGIIEYVIEDDSITDFSDAAMAAEAFLRQNAQRAYTVSFKTQIPGWETGQALTVDLPYYNLFGLFQVTSVSSTLLLPNDTTSLWEYTVEASTVPYRDKSKALFFTPKKVTFQMDGDYPAADGQYINNHIQVETYITAWSSNPMTWQEIENTVPSWTLWEAQFLTWKAMERSGTEWSYLNNYLTPYAKERLMQILQGKGNETDMSGLNLTNALFLETDDGISETLEPSDIVETTPTSATATYYLLPDQAQTLIHHLGVYVDNSAQQEKLLNAEVNINRAPGNPEGEFAMTITMRHAVV